MRQIFLRHIPVVLLIFWAALAFLVPLPWADTAPDDEEPRFHEVILLSDGFRKPRSLAFEALLLDSAGPMHRHASLLLYFPPDSVAPYRSGDVLVVSAKLAGGRAFVAWGKSGMVEHLEPREVPFTYGRWRIRALRLRDRLEAVFCRFFSGEEEKALVSALIFGDRRSLRPSQRYAFTDAGAMHVLAVSGLHVGIVQHIFMLVLSLGGLLVIPWEKKRLRVAHRLVVVAAVWFYAFLTGLSVSVMRSALMFSLLPLGHEALSSSSRYNRLAVAALVVLVVNPAALVSPSFLLSVSAVLAILYYVPRWRIYLCRRRWFRSCHPFLEWVIDMLLVSCAAQIGVLPWTLLFFGQVSNFFALTNLVVIPLTFLLVLLSALSLFVSAVPGCLAVTAFLMRLTEYCASAMNGFVRFVQALPGATTFFSFSGTLCAMLILFVVLVTFSARLFAEHRRGRWLLFAATVVTAGVMLLCYHSLLSS